MSSDVSNTTDASVLDYRETDPQEQVSAAHWRPQGPRCKCGADITEWHSATEARQLARFYGTDEWDVPACPACTDARDNGSSPSGVATAVKLKGGRYHD